MSPERRLMIVKTATMLDKLNRAASAREKDPMLSGILINISTLAVLISALAMDEADEPLPQDITLM